MDDWVNTLYTSLDMNGHGARLTEIQFDGNEM